MSGIHPKSFNAGPRQSIGYSDTLEVYISKIVESLA